LPARERRGALVAGEGELDRAVAQARIDDVHEPAIAAGDSVAAPRERKPFAVVRFLVARYRFKSS
jgi:hypothetical protein